MMKGPKKETPNNINLTSLPKNSISTKISNSNAIFEFHNDSSNLNPPQVRNYFKFIFNP